MGQIKGQGDIHGEEDSDCKDYKKTSWRKGLVTWALKDRDGGDQEEKAFLEREQPGQRASKHRLHAAKNRGVQGGTPNKRGWDGRGRQESQGSACCTEESTYDPSVWGGGWCHRETQRSRGLRRPARA